ncbi:MAG: cobyric acid synthase [Rhodospirillaceae bacterium]|nr:cobyric acid synthase [Rhodospirillaceae bacterium]
MGRAIMLQGTGSNVGKSVLAAGLLRALSNRGHAVRPFKPQNMSNNAAVAADGGEIGRAQALQARAARVAPSVHMNPVLLKPSSETGAQIVVQGKVTGEARAREFQTVKPRLMPQVMESFEKIRAGADFVVVEGAGSASETNLRHADIANMGFAAAADVPVVLIGDIDRGGVIASVVGTKAVIAPSDAALVAGFIVNKMRGDPSLFDDGMADIARRTRWPALGLVPFFDKAKFLPAEDSYDLAGRSGDGNAGDETGRKVRIAVPHLPRIANFDDLDPLKAEPDVDLVLVDRGAPLPRDADLVILPGSKATIADLGALRDEGWDIDILAHRRRGGRVLGLCGGFQMLGRAISDPDGLEGPPGVVEGLGLLEVDTVLTAPKTVREVAGEAVCGGSAFTGYEIHMGRTEGPDCERPLHRLSGGRTDGARSADGRVAGTYVHGLFGSDRHRADWLHGFGAESGIDSHDSLVERTLDELAGHLEAYVDIDRLIAMAR